MLFLCFSFSMWVSRNEGKRKVKAIQVKVVKREGMLFLLFFGPRGRGFFLLRGSYEGMRLKRRY